MRSRFFFVLTKRALTRPTPKRRRFAMIDVDIEYIKEKVQKWLLSIKLYWEKVVDFFIPLYLLIGNSVRTLLECMFHEF